METAIGASRWVVSRALRPVTDGLLESWTASSELGPNVRELKIELLYAEGMLNNAHGRDLHNRALEQLLLDLQNVAYNADDVLDELEYFRIQDELDGTYDTINAQDQGLVGGLLLNARHTARTVRKCLLGSGCSCCGRTHGDDEQQETGRGCMDTVTKCLLGSGCSCCGGRTHDDDLDQETGQGCMAKVISSAHNTAHDLLRLEVSNCPDLRLCPGTLDDGAEAGEGLQGLRSLTSLKIYDCPEFFYSNASSGYSLFPASLQSLDISGCTNLTSLVTSGCPEFFTSSASSPNSPFPASLQSLEIWDCADLTGEGFWELFCSGCLTQLEVYGSPKFFTCTDTEPSPRLNQQDLPHHSRSCELHTDDIAGVLAQPICARLSSFLTKLVFGENIDIERFTKEQEAALQLLTSLQKLKILSCRKLQSLPAGLSGLPNLKKFMINDLDSLQSIPKDGLPSSLTDLSIVSCPAIQWIPKGTLPSSLQRSNTS